MLLWFFQLFSLIFIEIELMLAGDIHPNPGQFDNSGDIHPNPGQFDNSGDIQQQLEILSLESERSLCTR